MTTTIKDLPPPYPNQALARSREFTQVDPQKQIREKNREIQEAHKGSGTDGRVNSLPRTDEVGQKTSRSLNIIA